MYIVKNLLSKGDVEQVYGHLMGEATWKIGGAYGGIDDPLTHYPRTVAMDANGMHSPFLSGYFICLMSVLRDRIQEEYGFTLPVGSLGAIGFNAQRKGNISVFHTDGDAKGKYIWSVVGFLTPQWDPSWGGELQIEDRTYTFEPGDFVVFRSNELHDALPIKVDTPFWRVSVACMMGR
jgi:hypothetical protein